ncbi:MAG: Lrp/AsnC family transcriptional regulator [Candidatus Syntrophonatronum acetioxidans]|uniref:siroheme decarboxylase n=1 Tax=Candidatus Syntrophonatronum acetioxidans TaxID=1795816 RepID=A0A424Y998_9FIRM|nr:MAG: Lrp/AsnC family transcriptional regulator [Candidatus Syntrophonatronum acetioxidans]
MDSIDRKLLNLMQKNFPLSSTPYRDLGEILEISEEEVINRLDKHKRAGLIRKIGGIFNPRSLGYKSTLVALEVKEENLEDAASFINRYPEVTHNYQRDHIFNLWFTLIAPSQERIKDIIDSVERLPGVRKCMNLPSVKMFKIGAYFSLNQEGERGGTQGDQ